MEFLAKNIQIEDKSVRIQFWDTAGTEKYRAITTGHYRNAHAAVIVYDITNEVSYQNLAYWLAEIRENAGEQCLVAIMANKVDIMFREPEKREVLKEQAEQFAKDNSCLFIDESSALADIFITEFFEAVIQSVFSYQMDLISKGIKTEQQLKKLDVDMSPHFEHRCCY